MTIRSASGDASHKDLASRRTSLPPHWPRLIGAVERPGSAGEWAGDAETWEAFLRDLQGNGLFPLAYRAWREAGTLETLPEGARRAAEARMTAYRAGWTGAWEEIAKVLGLFAGAGLRPVLLKGADLALRYYPEPHLRPLTDLDVLFPSTTEAESAFGLLEKAGFRPGKQGIPMDEWVLSQHLPDLHAPGTGFPVEVHGALVVSPRDSRWAGGAVRLLEGRRSYAWRGLALEGLAPEALVVHLCAHIWDQHAGEPPKAGVAFDLRAVLEREGLAFDWNRLVDLSRASGFSGAVVVGLRALEAALGVSAPEGVLSALSGAEKGAVLGLSPRSALTQRLLRRLWHGPGPASALKAAWRIAVPSRAYLRERYPEKGRWPALLLYPYRWGDQGWKLLRWGGERLGLGSRE